MVSFQDLRTMSWSSHERRRCALVARGTSDIHFSFCPTYDKDIRTGTTIDETRTLTTFVAGV